MERFISIRFFNDFIFYGQKSVGLSLVDALCQAGCVEITIMQDVTVSPAVNDIYFKDVEICFHPFGYGSEQEQKQVSEFLAAIAFKQHQTK